ncbi:hypothetical protein FALBO_13779 [Fusarium albosuccineum]|uniref:Uncharacterized protein n=1 Tax=Fusarium albosuccineum TaxID=1237068 RepID=A0A8H4PG40_9HYPO|nr:hypothetical protein FALBO_13779 [Fusarium albosuccineum]
MARVVTQPLDWAPSSQSVFQEATVHRPKIFVVPSFSLTNHWAHPRPLFAEMRLSLAGQAVFSGLAAIVTADVLPLDDIPLMCVTICGPIVELTSKCDIHGQRLAKRELDAPWVPKLAVEPPETDPFGVEPREEASYGNELEKRSFSIIRAAPTSFPFELTATEPVEEQPSTSTSTSSSTNVESVADQTSRTSTLNTRRASTTMSARASAKPTTVSPPTKSSLGEIDTTTTSGVGWADGEQSGKLYAHNDPEQECVCKNKSFDVAKVAALCHDCIIIDGHKQNNLDLIMKACNFTELAYSAAQDSVVDNVQVEATRPTTLAASQVQDEARKPVSALRSDHSQPSQSNYYYHWIENDLEVVALPDFFESCGCGDYEKQANARLGVVPMRDRRKLAPASFNSDDNQTYTTLSQTYTAWAKLNT